MGNSFRMPSRTSVQILRQEGTQAVDRFGPEINQSKRLWYLDGRGNVSFVRFARQ